MDIEQEIQTKGLTAPRVTPQRIAEVIIDEHYFTAGDGAHGACIAAGSERSCYPASLDLLTFCVLTLKNGFTVTGESACASPETLTLRLAVRLPVIMQSIRYGCLKVTC